jgi:hypothetical protein
LFVKNLEMGLSMKWLKYLAVLCVLLASQVVGVSGASAASDFDSFPITTDWHLSRPGCPAVDVGSTWEAILADGVPAAANQISANGTNGGWYVWKRENTDNVTRTLVVMVVKAESAPSVYTMSHSTGNSWLSWSGNMWLSTTTEGSRSSDTYDVELSLNSSCEPVASYWGRAGDGYSDYSYYESPVRIGMPVMTGRPFNFQNKMLLAVGVFDTPEGYAGPVVPYEYTTPVPKPYSGSVTCDGLVVGALIIEQGDNDGAATLTPTSPGSATWEYNLTDEPYAVAVSCGSEWAYSFGSVYPSSTTVDWYCDAASVSYDQNYCVTG